MIRNVLITGGAGFIGSKLCLKLLSKGYNVTILDNLSPQVHNHMQQVPYALKNTNFIIGDIRNKADLLKALNKQDAVIHLAAETGTGQSMYNISNYTEVNIQGSALLLDILANQKVQGIKKLLLASSRAVYGEGKYWCDKHGHIYPETRIDKDMMEGNFEVKCHECNVKAAHVATDENAKLHSSSIYGITKQVQEQMFMNIGKYLNIPTVIFRYQNVYGPGQSLSNPYTGILSIFSTRIRNHNPINIFEDGKESRDFIYVDDVVNATILGLESEKANYQIFNVGSGTSIDVFTVAKQLVACYKSNTNITITGQYRLGDIRHNYADIRKIRNLLGFKPQTDFTTGVQYFVEWVLSQSIATDNYNFTLQQLQSKGFLK